MYRWAGHALYDNPEALGSDLNLIQETANAGGQPDHENRRRHYKLTRTGKAPFAADISRMETVVHLARKLMPKTLK